MPLHQVNSISVSLPNCKTPSWTEKIGLAPNHCEQTRKKFVLHRESQRLLPPAPPLATARKQPQKHEQTHATEHQTNHETQSGLSEHWAWISGMPTHMPLAYRDYLDHSAKAAILLLLFAMGMCQVGGQAMQNDFSAVWAHVWNKRVPLNKKKDKKTRQL